MPVSVFGSHGNVRDNPKKVAIVAMGQSHSAYLGNAGAKGSHRSEYDEVWAVNGTAGVIQHDRAFVMDDLKEITYPASQKKPGGCAHGMLSWMALHPGPLYSSRAYPEYPGVVEYPLREVLENVGNVYLNNSVPYAVAFAMYKGVEELHLYGCDYTYPDNHISESGRACLEFLLGMAVMRGMTIRIAENSTLLDAHKPDHRFYGYVTQPKCGIVERDGKNVWTIIDDPAQ